jgi:hypothetical protein
MYFVGGFPNIKVKTAVIQMPWPRRPSIYYRLSIRSRGAVSCIYRDTWKEKSNYTIIKVKGIEEGGLRISQDHVPATSHETRAL